MNHTKNTLATATNLHCICKTLDKDKLKMALSQDEGLESLFSETSIYLSQIDIQKIKNLIQNIESVIKLKSFQERVLGPTPGHGPKGVFMGYDFHLSENGPQLIEINTNAGGAYLNLELAKAQIACCEGVEPATDLTHLEEGFLAMFQNEWKLQRAESELKSIAILDTSPSEQFLYPEFKLFQKLFEKNGIDCVITDPAELELRETGLYLGNKKIDLIYSRVTDFYFSSRPMENVRKAFEMGEVVVTPNPHHHALYARKSNLEIFSNSEELAKFDLSAEQIVAITAGVPKTVLVTNKNQQELWSQRKNFFFKPVSGFGSKATYRGDKITHRVWEELTHNEYVAQEIVRPTLRSVLTDRQTEQLKFDIRAYTYDGEVQLLAARLYSGQTTNFRTLGGGFAPVFVL